MATTYDVRIWKLSTYKGKRTTYRVRWTVAKKQWGETFSTRTLAESFRSDLVAAARKGEAFYIETGLPVSMSRAERELSWYELACAFVDMQWPRVAATTRRTHAEALTAVTPHMLKSDRGAPDAKVLRSALTGWAFNTNKRDADDKPREIADALRWVERNTRPVTALEQPQVLRALLDGLTIRLDGKPSAASVVSRRRKILGRAVEYAVELKALERNPIPALKWKAPRSVHVVDRRSVANPDQVRALLKAVSRRPRSGPRLVGFFACLYYGAMRPEEAVGLRKGNLDLPPVEWSVEQQDWVFPPGVDGWGEIHLDVVEPHAGKYWTDSGRNRDRRDQLKQRAVGEGRTVPSPPDLTRMLHAHIREFGVAPDGRLFVGERNHEELPKNTILRYWRWAREDVFTPDVLASPLAAVPYDLRHAGVSMMLWAGVPAVRVALIAGHSLEVLLSIYAKVLDGEEASVKRRIEAALDTPGAA